jgi:hypothetical protein
MDVEPETVEIRFDDQVNITTEWRRTTGPGLLFGDWYVMDGINVCHRSSSNPNCFTSTVRMQSLPPNSRFMVGHNPTGLAAVNGLEFWDARRIALALADADLEVAIPPRDMDPDFPCLIEAIIASSLMDHYVFPIAGWSV